MLFKLLGVSELKTEVGVIARRRSRRGNPPWCASMDRHGLKASR